MGSLAPEVQSMPTRTKGLIAELRRRSREQPPPAPSKASESDAADAAERRRTELKAQLSEDPAWIALRRRKTRRTSSRQTATGPAPGKIRKREP
jgi:hypothetical protein